MSNWIFNKLVPYALKFREWSKGKKHGSGILLLDNGNYIKGNWTHNNLNGKCSEYGMRKS